MSNTLILSKNQVTALYNQSSVALSGGGPSLIEDVTEVGLGIIIGSYILVSKPTPQDVVSAATGLIILNRAESMSYSKKKAHSDEYKKWLDNMNAGNFIGIKIQ